MRLGAFALLLTACGSDPQPLPAGLDQGALDLKSDPCTDFYQYACGGYVASHPITKDSYDSSRRDSAVFATERAQATLIASAVAGTLTSSSAQLVAAYDTACIAAATSSDRSELERLLGKIDAITPDAGLPEAVAALHAAGAQALFQLGSEPDPSQSTHVIALASQGGLGLPDPTSYLDPQSAVLTPYTSHIDALSSHLGHGDPSLARAAIGVETALARATLSASMLRMVGSVHRVEPLATLQAQVPHFDFAAYLAAVRAPAFTTLDVVAPAFFDALEQVLATTPLDDLKRYLRWRAIEREAGLLDEASVGEEYRFHYGVLYGVSITTPPRDAYCLVLTASELDWPMSQLYADQNGKKLPDVVNPLVGDVRNQLRAAIEQASWLDAPTRAEALAKLLAMRAAVAQPTDFGPYLPSVSMLPTTTLAASASALSADALSRSLTLIGSVDGRTWYMSPGTVNAAYVPEANDINLPAAILQAPLFDVRWPKAVNYGGIGTVIGHEVTHGFDDEGNHFDAKGELRDWWSADVRAQFDAKAQCLVDQYGALEGTPGHLIDGRLTLGENIADNGGVKLSYAALAPSKSVKLGDFTEPQVFFIAYAQAWCASWHDMLIESLLRTDPHSPPKARVNAVLANTPEFADAFSCRAGQPMAPKTRCGVW